MNNTIRFMTAGFMQLHTQVQHGLSFRRFWNSVSRVSLSDGSDVALDALAHKWSVLADTRLTQPQKAKIAQYVDEDNNGTVSPQEFLDWLHAINWLATLLGSVPGSNARGSNVLDGWCPNYGHLY